MSLIKRVLLCLSCTAFTFGAMAAEPGTTIFRRGRIITMDATGSIAEAMAVQNGRVIAVGTAAAVARQAGPNAKVVDLGGKTVLPGIIDTHTHAISWARGVVRNQIDATKMTSLDELIAELRRRAEKAPPGTWITGAGWDDAKLQEKRYVRRSDIDAVTPRHPVFLVHVSGHLSVANSEALRIAGVTRETPAPEGGLIEKDAAGELTGILKESADNLVSRNIPPDPPDLAVRAARLASERAAAVGITTYHDIAVRPADMRAYQKAHAAGELRARVHMVPLVSSVGDAETLVSSGVATGFGDDVLKLGGVKLFTDGGMGARTIAIHAPPVQGEPENFGVLLWSDADLRKAHRLLAQNGWQLITHAIGDRAIEQVLDSYAAAASELKLEDRRWRIAHSGITPPAIQRRYRDGAVIADGNPAFVHWIGSWFTKYGPERVRWSYPGKSYFENGVVLTAGTDVPVTPVSPWWGVWAAVARREKLTGNVLAPEERLSIRETLKVYTNNGAYAGFDEHERGSIEREKFADFIVVDRDPLTIPTDELKDVQVLETYVGGRRVFSARQTN